MQELAINVTVEQANLILEGLGKLPFARVYELIADLQTQAKTQLRGHTATSTANSPQLALQDQSHGE